MDVQTELWGITTLFNPGHVKSRLDNYMKFRARSRSQGLPLVTVELAFGDSAFELCPEKDAEILIQRRCSDVLWQKGRMLNLALAALPRECTKVAWADADILFDDDDWVKKTSSLLNRHVVVQPFAECIRLPKNGQVEDYPKRALDKTILGGHDEGTYSKSVCYRMAKWRNPTFSGATGYVWSAQRRLLSDVGFYDRCIVGGADSEMALAFHYAPGHVPDERRRISHPGLICHINEWHKRVHHLVQKRITFRRGVIHHLWHGDTAQRNYGDRHAILTDHSFDPESDLEIDDQGCWRLREQTHPLKQAIRGYFESRREDG